MDGWNEGCTTAMVVVVVVWGKVALYCIVLESIVSIYLMYLMARSKPAERRMKRKRKVTMLD